MNEQLMKEVLATMPFGVCILDPAGRIAFWNEAAERLAGYSSDDIAGQRCCDGIFVHLDEEGRELCGSDGCGGACRMLRQAPCESTVFLRHRIGHHIRSTTQSIPITGDDGELVATTVVFRGADGQLEWKPEYERIRRPALIDPLTHVGNRLFAEQVITASLAAIKRHDHGFGLLFVGIDRFKVVNETYNQHVGDAMLKVVAQSLSEGVRVYDQVCRWGGERFLVLLHHVSPEQLGIRAGSLRRRVHGSSLRINGADVGVTISVGATMARPRDTVEKLVERADWLLSSSKRAGGNQVSFG